MSSGRARIDAARAATAAHASAPSTVPSDLVDGIRVYWSEPGIAMRDETAFRHALRTGYELKNQGKRLTDRAIIDAYLTAYQTAQEIGAGLRPSEIPSVRDLATMARRVRSYVYAGKSAEPEAMQVAQSSAGRKALSTMGRRGGQKAAERWKTEPEGAYAKRERAKLAAANKRRKAVGSASRARVLAVVTGTYAELGRMPTRREIMDETGLSRATVTRHLSTLRAAGELPD